MKEYDIYKLLHQGNTPIEEIPLTLEEIQRLKSIVNPKKKSYTKPIAMIAIASVFIFSIFFTPIGKNVYAETILRIHQISYSLQDTLGVPIKGRKIAMEIGKEVELDNMVVRLHEIALSGEDLMIVTLLEGKDTTLTPEECDLVDLDKLVVNGKSIPIYAGAGSFKKFEGGDNVFVSNVTFDLPEPLPTTGKARVRFDLRTPSSFIPNIARFDVELSMDELWKDTLVKDLNQELPLGIFAHKLYLQPHAQSLYLHGPIEMEQYESPLFLEATNEQGHTTIFHIRHGFKVEDYYQMKMEPLVNNRFGVDQELPKAKSLHCQFYQMGLQEGQETKKIPVGEDFTLFIP